MRAWRPKDRIWRNKHSHVLHFVVAPPAYRSNSTTTACGIDVPDPSTQVERRDLFPFGYEPCAECYPLGKVF